MLTDQIKSLFLSAPENFRGLLLYLAVGILSLLIGRSLSGEGQLIAAGGVLLLIGLTLRYYRQTFFFIVFYMLIEGYLRKKYFSNISFILIKDFFIGLIYLRIFLPLLKNNALNKIIQPHPAYPFLIALLVWGLIEVFNSYSYILIGVLGFKVTFFYLPIFFLSPLLLRDLKDMRRFLLLLVLTAIPIALLGLQQVESGQLLKEINPDISYAMDGTPMARPRSTFYYSGQFQTFCHTMTIISLALTFLPFRDKRMRILAIGALAGSILGLIISMARTAWITVAIQVPVFLLINKMIRPLKLLRIVATGAVLLAILFWQVPTVKNYFYQRLSTMTRDPYGYVVEERGLSHFTKSITLGLKTAPLLGHGLGTASPASRYLGKYEIEDGPPWEGGLFKMLHEMGLTGFFLFAGLMLNILLYSWRSFCKAPPGEAKLFLSMIFVLQLGFIFWFIKAPIFDEIFITTLFWLISGSVFMLNRVATEPAVEQ